MTEMSELYGESTNDTKILEYLEESSISYSDYQKLKQENECYRQELHVLRLKLKSSDAVNRYLQESNETWEREFKQMVDKTCASTVEKYTADRKAYQSCIGDLEKTLELNKEEINRLGNELKKYKDMVHLNERPCHQITMKDETLLKPLEEEIMGLNILLYSEKKKVMEFEDKLVDMKNQNQHLDNNYHIALRNLAEKVEALEKAQKYARELATDLKKLELGEAPASDTCKGNSLFAEVEDNRQMLLDKMKVLTSKYNDAKRELNTKIAEVKLLRAEKSTIARKWEIDAIDTLQENTDLLNQYKRRISELENKLKFEIEKNHQVEEIQSTEDSFDYARKLLVTKGKEIKELNEKIEKQVMQLLVKDEAKYVISKQLRYWRSKAMSLEAYILAIKTQLETEQINVNKTLLAAIENCTFSDKIKFENETCDDSKLIPVTLTPEDNTYEGNLTEASKTLVVDSMKEHMESTRRVVCFTEDTKDTENKSVKKQAKQRDYPIISYCKISDNMNLENTCDDS